MPIIFLENDLFFFQVLGINIHPSYKGKTQNYYANLALIVTKEMFNMTATVQPACIRNIQEVEQAIIQEETAFYPNVAPAMVRHHKLRIIVCSYHP